MKFQKLIFAALFFTAFHSCQPYKSESGDAQPKQASTVKPHVDTSSARIANSVTIAAVGDIMLGTSYPNSGTLPADSAKYAFTMVEEHLKNADLTFGNLEGTLLDNGKPAAYKLRFRSKGYLFRSPVKYADIIKNAGFDVVSVANNHIDDFGLPGRLSTVKTLESAGIYAAGLLSRPSIKFVVKGVKYGFCAFSPNSQTSSFLDLKHAAKIIKELKQECDIVIVSFHGGGEGPGFQHITCEKETYVGENRGNVHAFALNAVDSGADLVFGHGPHVSRAMELYHGRLIAYSLGNFCTYRGVSIEGVCGIAPLLKVNVSRKGEFLSARIISVKQSHLTGLQVDTVHRAAKKIKALTETDLPQSGLKITEWGMITAQGAAGASLNTPRRLFYRVG
jgi:hypothetical protein